MSHFKDVLRQARELQRKAEKAELGKGTSTMRIPDRCPAEACKAPFINRYGDLIIPMDGDPKYHWWRRGGQSVLDTLLELRATEDILNRYVMNWRFKIKDEQLN